MERMTLSIEGMSCGHCVHAVTEALKRVEGAVVEQVEIGSATVHFDPAKTSADVLIDAVSDEGYTAARVSTPRTG